MGLATFSTPASSAHSKIYAVFDKQPTILTPPGTTMALSSFLKFFALLAFLTVNVIAVNSETPRRLRDEPSEDNLVTRKLSKNPFKVGKIIMDNFKNQPVIDKAIKNAKKIKYYTAEKAKKAAKGK